jgi:hypothetical protein
MKTIASLVLAALAGAAAAQTLDPCMKAYNDEAVAIEREAKAKQNVGSKAAKQRAARAAATRLQAAARQAKRCQDEAKAKEAVAVAKPAAEGECKARVNARMVELERRFAGGALDPAQQNVRREEEVRLQAELNECNRRARER